MYETELVKLRRKLAQKSIIFDGSHYRKALDNSELEHYLQSDLMYRPKEPTRKRKTNSYC